MIDRPPLQPMRDAPSIPTARNLRPSVRNTVGCFDCFWLLVQASGPICMHPQAVQTIPDYYTGIDYHARMSMNSMRALGPCGPGGALFETAPTAAARGDKWTRLPED